MNAAEAMPSKILLCAVGLTNNGSIADFRSAVAENIRQSSYFIQVFEDDWGPRNLFRKMFHLSVECRDDPVFPMREVAVFLKTRAARNRSGNTRLPKRSGRTGGCARVSFR